MRNKTNRRSVRPAFTLVELMVAIVIIVVLAAISFSVSRSVRQNAEKVTCMNRLRQVGTIMMGRATENHNRIQIFAGGSGSFELRPYFIIRDELNLPASPQSAYEETLKELMFCPSAPAPVSNPHWNCYGVNITDNEMAGSFWTKDRVEDENGRSASVSTLRTASVRRPASCVLIADSCHSSGREIFRISGGDLIGLRHKGEANALFLDGSARTLGPSQLGGLGFKKAFDTSSTPPQSVSLPGS